MGKENKIRVGVIFGGRSGEHEVSLMSARSVLAALDPEKYEVTPIAIDHNGLWLTGENLLEAIQTGDTRHLLSCTILPDPAHRGLHRIRKTTRGETLETMEPLDVVFPVLHGTFGEDGTIQGLLELSDLAYVGAGVLGSALGMDKGIFKDVMVARGIPVVDSLVILKKEVENQLDEVIGTVVKHFSGHYPLFTKPANLGSSVGISKCQSRADLIEGLLEASRFDRRILVEKGMDAREIEVSVLGNDDPVASVPGEILPSREFYSYEAKYLDGTSQLLIPAPLEAGQAEQARSLAVQAFKAIDGWGLARVDFFLERTTGKLFVSELNTLPGFTEISMYAKLWQAGGLPYPALVDRLIELALERKQEKDQIERKFPGPRTAAS